MLMARATMFGTAIVVLAGCSGPTRDIQGDLPAPAVVYETWDAVFVRESKIGYTHTVATRASDEADSLLNIVGETEMKLARLGQVVRIRIEIEATESTEGAVHSFQCKTIAGPEPITMEGRCRNGYLQVVTESPGEKTDSSMKWDGKNRGFFAVEQSLRKRPMKSGETRDVTFLLPKMTTIQVITSRLEAGELENTELLDGERELLRINATAQVAGEEIETVYWTDPSGETLKSYMALLGQTTYRTDKALAIAAPAEVEYDLGYDMLVRVDQPIPDAHETKSIRYQVSLKQGNPAKKFLMGCGQDVRPIDENHALITVTAVRPTIPEQVDADVAPTSAELSANHFIQSDDPSIVRTASEIVGNAGEDRWLACVKLERWVFEEVHGKNFSQAFATASTVLENREGDCTEHAVLLAALCRAAGIPARVVVGLVYSDCDQGFAYHMWNEAWVNDRWVPLDATLGRGGTGAAHLKLRHSALSQQDAGDAMLSVISVMRQLEIEVLHIGKND